MVFENIKELYEELIQNNIKDNLSLKKYITQYDLQPDISCIVCNKICIKKIIGITVQYSCNICCKVKKIPLIFSKFKGSLPIIKQLKLIVFFVQELTLKQTKNFSKISKKTIIKFNKTIRNILYYKLKFLYAEKIGGNKHIVQIDETHFSLRKYNKGRIRKLLIFFGAIDKNTKELRINKIKKKNIEVLGRNIRKFIKVQSEIHSDKFTSYMSFFHNNNDFLHKFVNHQRNFVDPITKANTQLIESIWSSLKRFSRRREVRSKKELKYYIKEFEFRRIKRCPDGLILFEEIIKMIFSHFILIIKMIFK